LNLKGEALYLARLPAKRNRLAEKDSRQLNSLEADPYRQSLQLWRDLLGQSKPFYPKPVDPT
jgi:hypothetical protein